MPTINVNNVNLHYEVAGDGPETIVFSHGYLMNSSMFDGQIDVLKDRFRCIAFDHRGHGQSEVTQDGYELDNLVTDAIAFIEGLDLGAVHFVGMSTGGFVGMRIALRRPDLLKSLILMDTSAEEEPKAAKRKNFLLLWIVKNIGWFGLVSQVMPIMFHSVFLKDKNRREELKKWQQIVTGQDIKSMALFGKSIFNRDNVLEKLSTINIPTAVIVGDHDVATPPACSKRMAATIPNAELHLIADAGHSAAVEQPQEVADAMEAFYAKLAK